MVIAWVVFAAAFALYLRTVPPGLPWGDAGELIAAAHGLGLAHPPGSPLYLLLAKVATLIPIGTIPLRVALLSSAAAAAAVTVLYVLLRRLLRSLADERVTSRAGRALLVELPAAGAALAFAATPTLWSYAVYAKGYTLHLLLVALVVACGLRWLGTEQPAALRLAWLVAGLAMAVHPATLFALPALGYLLWTARRRGLSRRAVLRTLLLALPGLALYLYVPLRALAEPAMHWGFPATAREILAYLTAAQYSYDGGPLGWVSATAFLRSAIRHLVWPIKEFTPLVMPVIALGTVVCWRRSRGAALFTFLVAGVTYLAPLASAGFDESPDGPAYYLPVYAMMAIWLGLGLRWLVTRVAIVTEPQLRLTSWRAVLAGGLVIAALPAIIGSRGYPAAEARRTDIPARFARFLLGEARLGAVVIVQEVDVLFPLWFVQQVEGVRPDVTVIPAPWLFLYPRQIARRYPDLVIPQGPGAGRVDAFLLANAGRRPLYVIGPTEGLGAAEGRLVPSGVLFELRGGAADPTAHRRDLARFEAVVLGGGSAPLDGGTIVMISRLYTGIARAVARGGWLDEALHLTARATSLPGLPRAERDLPVMAVQASHGPRHVGENPTISGLSVGSGAQGTRVTTTILGTNLEMATSADFGAGITVTLGANTATSLTVDLAIGRDAALGPRSFTVTFGLSGVGSGGVMFTVEAAGPTITGLSVIRGGQGATVTTVIRGTNLAGATRADFGAGITVNLGASTATSLEVTLGISPGATPGPRPFSVTTPGGTASSGTLTFTVLAAPRITGLSVDRGTQGTTVTTVISGTNLADATAADFGAGITVSLGLSDATSLTVDLTITLGAATGPRPFSMTTPGGTADSAPLTFTVVAPPPARPIPVRTIAPPADLPVTGDRPFDTRDQLPTGRTVAQEIERATNGQVSQDFETGRTILAVAGQRFSLGLVGAGQTLSSGLTRRQAAPRVTLDPLTGTVTIFTAEGLQLQAAPFPLDLRRFLELLRPGGVTGAQISQGQISLTTPDPGLLFSTRLDFQVTTGAGAPGFAPNPDGTVTITYQGGDQQKIFSRFADVGGLLQQAQTQFPGLTAAAGPDETVSVALAGQRLRLKPDFTVTRSGGTTKRIIVEGGTTAFDLGDGRRQRFTVTP